jgi:hypothetical protein
MSIHESLRESLKEAMKAKDAVTLRTVRSIMTACTNELVAVGLGAPHRHKHITGLHLARVEAELALPEGGAPLTQEWGGGDGGGD